jgi:hypothetical protein
MGLFPHIAPIYWISQLYNMYSRRYKPMYLLTITTYIGRDYDLVKKYSSRLSTL